MTEEEAKTKWQPIVWADGRYEVSSDGRVRSLARKSSRHTVHGCELVGKIQDGYRRVCLSLGDRQTLKFVHVLVAEAFLGSRPTPIHQVNHIDGNRQNNAVENLQWATPGENTLHSYRVLGRIVPESVRWAAPKGENGGRAKVTNAEADTISVLRAIGVSAAETADIFGVHPSQISRIARGKTKHGFCGLAGRP